MLNFLKKINSGDESVKVLSEEEIQKKLYGDYRPGTLGKVLRVEKKEQEVEKPVENIEAQASLFAALEEPEVEEIAAQKQAEKKLSSLAANILNAKKSTEPEKVVTPAKPPLDLEEVSQEEEVLELNLDQAQAQFLDERQKPFESLKLSVMEFFENVRSVDLRFYWIGIGVVLAFILIFSIISSYVVEDTDNDLAANTNLEATSVTSRIESPEEISSGLTEVAAFPVALTNSPTESAPDEIGSVSEPAEKMPPISESVEQLAPPVAAPKVSEAEPYYTIQVCVSNDLKATEKLIENLNTAGMKAFYRERVSSRGKALFFVYVGKMSDRDEAILAHQKAQKTAVFEPYPDSFVTQIKDE